MKEDIGQTDYVRMRGHEHKPDVVKFGRNEGDRRFLSKSEQQAKDFVEDAKKLGLNAEINY